MRIELRKMEICQSRSPKIEKQGAAKQKFTKRGARNAKTGRREIGNRKMRSPGKENRAPENKYLPIAKPEK